VGGGQKEGRKKEPSKEDKANISVRDFYGPIEDKKKG